MLYCEYDDNESDDVDDYNDDDEKI